jgi:hypothetical protein
MYPLHAVSEAVFDSSELHTNERSRHISSLILWLLVSSSLVALSSLSLLLRVRYRVVVVIAAAARRSRIFCALEGGRRVLL